MTFRMIMSRAFLEALFLAPILTFGVDLTSRLVWPSFDVVKSVRIPGFVERPEAFFVVLWVVFAVSKIAGLVYAASLGITQLINQVLRFRHRNAITWALGGVVFFSGTRFTGVLKTFDIAERMLRAYVYIEFGIPLFLLLLAMLLRKPEDGGKTASHEGRTKT